ncbi:hypothetical protein [Vibrio sp. D431a]|uniref:hypothetical protein n=1 Tax=Vibrio sp. D431a TaxID=2837388 RepID=UPI0025538093|nr:hypothetical protein [Vibrio sp. D431a]MDK9793785.1 hypothetical protein [Vibrio sp. D431a]
MSELKQIIEQLDQAKKQLSEKEISPVQYSNTHTQLVKNGLELLAEEQGVQLKKVIEQRVGELTVICETGSYGEQFTETLNNYHIRMGLAPKKGFVIPSNTWGYMGVFEVEKMIRDHAA